MTTNHKKALVKLRQTRRALSQESRELVRAQARINKDIFECESQIGGCRAEIDAKKEELSALEGRLSVLDDNKNRLQGLANAKHEAVTRIKVVDCWLEMARLCVEFLVDSKNATPEKTMGLAADLLKKSYHPGKNLARIYGCWPYAVDVASQIDWPTLVKDWAIECWVRIEEVAPIKEVECCKKMFLRFARRWINGQDFSLSKKKIERIKDDWEHFSSAAVAAKQELLRRAEGQDLSHIVEHIRKIDEVGKAVCNKLDVMDGHLATAQDGFKAEDRRRLMRIERAAVYSETPTEAQIAGDVRRRQIKYGADRYKPQSRHEKGVSFAHAAEKAIRAPQFNGCEGAYSMLQVKTLARAIQREYKKGKDSAT